MSRFLEILYTHQLPQLCGAIMALILMSIGLPILDWRLALALLWVVPVAIEYAPAVSQASVS